MKNKLIYLIFGMVFLFLISNALVSAALCCEKIKTNGMWCQDATNVNECDSKYTHWNYKVCDEVPECNMTCVNSKTGECSEQTPQKKCIEDGGTPYDTPEGEISKCQERCCVLGQDAWFVNPTECNALFTRYGAQGTIRLDITTRDACLALQTNIITGACIISTDTEKACVMNTNTECTSDNINELAQHLKNPTSVDKINVDFKAGLLCTATLPNGNKISDCIPTNNTACKDYKVYYRDGCGNLANVYDINKWNNRDYWTYMKEDYDPTVCNVTAAGSTTCGNCDTTANTVCETWENADISARPPRISNPDGLVCGSMSCKVDTNGDGIKETKEHGDSWCADITGAVNSGIVIIDKNLTTGVINAKDIADLKNASKYNLPGTRYYKLTCSFGEVLVEECRDYRNEVCIQGVNDDSNPKRTQASCEVNPWLNCMSTTTRSQCETNTSLCKWIPGYTWFPGQVTSESLRKEMQGSCAPLIAPGWDFWKPNSQGNGLCQRAMTQVNTLFETSAVWTKRSNLKDWSDKTLAHRCIDGCYAIPGYANEFVFNGTKVYPEEVTPTMQQRYNYSILTLFYNAYQQALPSAIDTYSLSLRSGAYCHRRNNENKWLTGIINYVTGSQKKVYDCTPGVGSKDKSLEKMRDYPVYLTNNEWIQSITDRAISIGDCGYKMNINGKYSAPESEMITAIFQKLSQKGNVKSNITVEQIIWKGGAYIKGDLEPYETELATAIAGGGYTCNPDNNEICTTTAYNPDPCIGGTVNTAATCPPNSVCCVYTMLGE
jgi:cytoskeletal protein CcmA (bactofilin family)